MEKEKTGEELIVLREPKNDLSVVREEYSSLCKK